MGTAVPPSQPVQMGYITSVPQYPIQSEVSALAHRHITLIWGALGVIVVTLALAAVGGWVGYHSYEKTLAKAEASEAKFEQKNQQYQQQFVAFQQQIAQDSADRQAATLRESQLVAQIAARASQPLPPVIQTGLKPDAPANATAAALAASYAASNTPLAPQVTPDERVSITAKETAILVQTKVGFDRMSLDLKDETSLYTIEQSKTDSLGKDLQVCQQGLGTANGALADAKVTIADYKKAAIKTKWQKIWGGTKIGALIAASVIFGHKI